MIGIQDVKVTAHNPEFPLEPVYVFVDSAQSFRIKNVPKKIGKWDITSVYVNVSYPDNTTVSKECVLNGCVWVGTVGGCSSSGTCTNGFVVTASGIDEDGNAVSNYVLGAGDLYVKNLDGTISPETTAARMYFYDTTPTSPKKGDVVFISGTMNVWDGTQWNPCADLSGKQDALTNAQISAIDSVVDERATIVKYQDGSISSFNIVGRLDLIPNPGDIVEAKIGSTVTSIGDQAFTYSYGLTSVTIPDSVTSIGEDAFADCSSLTSLTMGNGVTSIGTSAFYGCRGLTSITIPNSVTSIGNYAFANCYGLISVTIGNSVTSIGASAFRYCMGLSSLTIPNSVTSIGYETFHDCGLTSLVFQGKTLTQVQNIEDGNGNKYYPWGLSETSIKTWNDASKEWVNEQGYLSSIPNTYKTYNDTVTSLPSSGFAKTSDIKNATITITQGGTTKGSFTLNQSSDQTIDIDAGGGGGSVGYTVTVCAHGTEGGGATGRINLAGFRCAVEQNILEVNGHDVSPTLIFHGIEYVDVPSGVEPTTVYFNGVEKTNAFVTLTGDTTIDLWHYYCIAAGTMIPLADGSLKPIEEITYNDDLLVWDFDEGKTSSAKPSWIKKRDYTFYYWETKLASGKSIKTCGQFGHRFFDLGTNTWVYASDINGKTIYTLDGADTVVSSERIDGKVDFFNIITKGHINHFGNGILLGCSLENHLYPVQDMRFVKDNRALRPYSEFEGEVPEWWYNDCRYSESSASKEYLINYYKNRIPVMLAR